VGRSLADPMLSYLLTKMQFTIWNTIIIYSMDELIMIYSLEELIMILGDLLSYPHDFPSGECY
jgi:hypothetical protein